jgi:predicted lactoylglutathione lyase
LFTISSLLTEPFFKTFTKREICDMNTHSEGLLALSCNSRAEVASRRVVIDDHAGRPIVSDPAGAG